jgi:hypothetical protein
MLFVTRPVRLGRTYHEKLRGTTLRGTTITDRRAVSLWWDHPIKLDLPYEQTGLNRRVGFRRGGDCLRQIFS